MPHGKNQQHFDLLPGLIFKQQADRIEKGIATLWTLHKQRVALNLFVPKSQSISMCPLFPTLTLYV
jgi:hypothetical protein